MQVSGIQLNVLPNGMINYKVFSGSICVCDNILGIRIYAYMQFAEGMMH
jgi:hypothetical protein